MKAKKFLMSLVALLLCFSAFPKMGYAETVTSKAAEDSPNQAQASQGSAKAVEKNPSQTQTSVKQAQPPASSMDPETMGIVTAVYADENYYIHSFRYIYKKIGESYKTEQIDIPGYVFLRIEGNPSGTITKKGQNVYYIYKKGTAQSSSSSSTKPSGSTASSSTQNPNPSSTAPSSTKAPQGGTSGSTTAPSSTANSQGEGTGGADPDSQGDKGAGASTTAQPLSNNNNNNNNNNTNNNSDNQNKAKTLPETGENLTGTLLLSIIGAVLLLFALGFKKLTRK